MTIKDLKRYIFENQKIEFILDSIGCHHIKYHPGKDFYSCGNYDGDNVGAINVKNNEYLDTINWTRQQEFCDSSDIITLVQYNRKCNFIEAIKYLHKILGLTYKPGILKKEKEKNKFDPLAIFKNARNAKRRVDISEIQTLDENTLDEYVPMLHINWFNEGIMPWARERFGICYSYKHKRVVIPHRYWLTGDLIGMNMRTVVDNYEELGINKYYLTEGMNKSINLYGLYENYNSIQEAGYVVVFEGEKSVLKMYSKDGHENPEWANKYGFNGKACVALSGKTVSFEQQRILIGLNTEIVIALDKDVDVNEIRHICEQFYRIRQVSYIYDKWGLLGDKDSPADKSNKVYQFLFKYRIRYDENEHRAYLNSLKVGGV